MPYILLDVELWRVRQAKLRVQQDDNRSEVKPAHTRCQSPHSIALGVAE